MSVSFDEIMKKCVSIYNLAGTRAAFIDFRVERKSLPSGLFLYEVRSDEDDWPYSVEDAVWVNHAGTIITAKPLPLLHMDDEVYIYLDDDDPWCVEDHTMLLADFLKEEMGTDSSQEE